MKSMRTSTYLMAGTALLAAAMPLPARADDKDDGSTTVNLSAEARRTVQQDRVTATLSIEKAGKTADEVQEFINGKMQEAKKLYDVVDGVKVSTGGYNVYKEYEPEPAPRKDGSSAWTPEEREKHSIWRGNQQLILDGAKKDELLQLIGTLQQQGFAAQGLNFYMSRAAEDAIKDQLIVEALQNIKARGANIQQALGMRTIRYVRIDLGDNGPQPVPMMARAMSAKAFDAVESMPSPVVEAGETEVVVHVSAEVKLK